MTILEIIAAIPPVDVLLALQQSVQQAAAAAVETVRVEVSTPTPPDVSGWHKARDVADVIVKLGAAGALISGIFWFLARRLLRPTMRAEVLTIFEKDIRNFRRVIAGVDACNSRLELLEEAVEQLEEGMSLLLEMLEDTREWTAEQTYAIDRLAPIDRRRQHGEPPNGVERRRDASAIFNARLRERLAVLETARSSRRERVSRLSDEARQIGAEIDTDEHPLATRSSDGAMRRFR
jgi:hypothetical protein